ncbi:helix-turn-helix domain-containing protein [Streptomyces sp. NPDC012888]|uniref:PucR family transcriptional regulator ligand-binding domain-containing protein n=1 Tax=Streptomyces sp. NPDC012888 TaxID=3364855 RepID=UPI0036CD1786
MSTAEGDARGTGAAAPRPPAPAPTAPPTPTVPLAALGLRLLAGPEEAGRTEVHGVHASEMADPSPYLLGGELLLTAGAWSDDPAAYVGRLARAGVAALGFGVTPVHERVPRPLVDACAAAGLPLVEVEPGTPFAAVARTVWRLMAEARTRELRRVAEAQQSLAAAASRPDPVPAVLGRLASALAGYAELTGGAGTPAAAPTADRPVPPPVREALGALAARVAGTGPVTATDTAAGWQLSAYALGRRPAADPGRVPGPVLAIATPERTPGDHTIAGAAAVLLTLLTAPRQGAAETRAGAARSAALLRLLLGRPPAEAAALLGPGPWHLVHARPATGGAPGAEALDSLAAGLAAVLVDAAGPPVRILTAREPEPRAGWRLGVSGPAGAGELAAADAQAADALRRAEAARAALLRHREGGLAALVPPGAAEAHARATLAPLGPALRETLRVWLAHHGGWDRTAASLGVHRNTVRQRVSRCAALLDRDLDDPDVRMELWFALGTASRVRGDLEAGAEDVGGVGGVPGA